MTCVKIIIFILIIASGLSAQNGTPVDYNKWQIDDTTFSLTMGALYNYPDTDSTFAKIDNTLLADGDSAYYNNTSILKTRISDNGRVVVTIGDIEVWQRPVKLIWLNTQTKNWIDIIPSLSWGEPVKDSNSVKWNFPGFDYSLIKDVASVKYQINFRKPFLDSAVTLYNQRPDSNYIALANVHAYSFVNIDDSTLLDVAEVDFKTLKKVGNYFLRTGKQFLQWDGSKQDTVNIIPIKQRWVKVNNKIYCIEFVMMSDVKKIHELYPNLNIWHNTALDIQVGSSTDDAASYNDNWNVTDGSPWFGAFGSFQTYSGFRYTNVTIPKGANIASMYFEVRCAQTRTYEPDMIYQGEDEDNASTFSSTDDWSSRVKTTANVNVTSGYGTWTGGVRYKIPNNSTPANMGSILKEVVDRDGWSSGNAFVLLPFSNNNNNNVVMRYSSRDASAAFAPKIYIVYSVGVGEDTPFLRVLQSRGGFNYLQSPSDSTRLGAP